MTLELPSIQPQSTQSQGIQAQEPQVQESKPLENKGAELQEQAQSPTGLNDTLFQQLSAEYEKEGSLSESSYTMLAAQGIPKNVVDIYLKGLESQVQTMTRKVYEAAGNEETYRKAQDWALKHWNAGQQEAFNKAIHSGDESLVLLTVQGLTSQYQQNLGARFHEPQLMQGSRPQGQVSNAQGLPETFESTGQLMAAIRDPRYEQDEAYREKVKMALHNSRIL